MWLFFMAGWKLIHASKMGHQQQSFQHIHSRVSAVIAAGLVPVWCQGIGSKVMLTAAILYIVGWYHKFC